MQKSTISIIALMLCALFATFCFTACGSGDNSSSKSAADSSSSKSALVGSWESDEAAGTIYTFNSDGTGTLSGDGYKTNFTYTEKDGKLEYTYEGSSEKPSDEYTIEGNKLSLKDKYGATITYTKK